MRLRNEQIRALLVALRETHEQEIDCAQFLTYLASYAEARAEGREVGGALAAAEAHERLCADCRDECAALVGVLNAERG
jgi:hypothetical protein